MKLGEIVKGTQSHFNCYRDGDLHYYVMKQDGFKTEVDIDNRTYYEFPVYKKIFEFVVPVSDTGTGIFKHQHKSVELMRWIRKALEQQTAEVQKIIEE